MMGLDLHKEGEKKILDWYYARCLLFDDALSPVVFFFVMLIPFFFLSLSPFSFLRSLGTGYQLLNRLPGHSFIH